MIGCATFLARAHVRRRRERERMLHDMRCTIVALAVTAMLVAPTGAFYLPGVAPQDYARVRAGQIYILEYIYIFLFSPRQISSSPRSLPLPPAFSATRVFFGLVVGSNVARTTDPHPLPLSLRRPTHAG